MYKILVVDSGLIDRRMVCDVLRKEFASEIDVSAVSESAEAAKYVKDNRYDLMIVNIPYHSRYSDFVEALIHRARGVNSSMSLILTSVKREDRIARMAENLSADSYLLKPYRREKLISLVDEVFARAVASKGVARKHTQPEGSLTAHLKELENFIHECDYKKSKETAQNYMALIYADENAKNVRSEVINFAQGILEIAHIYADERLQKKLENAMERFFTDYNIHGRRFEYTKIIEEMIDSIFVELEKIQIGMGDEMRKVLNYIELNIKKGVTLDSAAEYVNMSPSYFSKVFKKATGTNFIVYVTNRRMEIAKEMLQNTNMPVINIACELSYNETNYFSRVFKKKVGLSPTEYRQRYSTVRREEE